MEIINDWMGPNGAGQIISRWFHYVAGAAWVGLLYYFNFVQAPAFHEMSRPSRSDALSHITERALLWLRWSAAATLLTGILILGFQRNLSGDFSTYFTTTRGTAVAFGSVLGVIMFLNVWFVINPNQLAVVAAAPDFAAGRPVSAEVTLAGKRLARAQRANTLLSFPMLWFMGAAPHFAESVFRFPVFPGRDVLGAAWVIFIVLVGFIELSALGQIGGIDSRANSWMFDDWRWTVGWGLITWAILWIGAFEIVIARA